MAEMIESPYGRANMPLRRVSRAAALRGVIGGSRSVRARIRALAGAGSEGNAMLEFALTLPVLLMIVTGIWQFGVLFNNLISLTQAVTSGAQVLQSDRLSTSGDPCADTYNAVVSAAPSLIQSKIKLTITMNNASSITANSCPGKQTQLAMGGPVTVQASYPYSVIIAGLTLGSGNMQTGAVTEIEY